MNGPSNGAILFQKGTIKRAPSLSEGSVLRIRNITITRMERTTDSVPYPKARSVETGSVPIRLPVALVIAHLVHRETAIGDNLRERDSSIQVLPKVLARGSHRAEIFVRQ
jgi:hypothetical protein